MARHTSYWNRWTCLAALVPLPRMHLTRYHGVFAPHSKLRALRREAQDHCQQPAWSHELMAEYWSKS